MSKEAVSFIPCVAREEVRRARDLANMSLETLQKIISAHGESLDDAVTYQKQGANYKIETRKSECLQWLDKTNAPSYMRADAIKKAVTDLGRDNLDYWNTVAAHINIRAGNCGDSPIIDLAADVEIDENGKWVVSPAWVDGELEGRRITLDERQKKDLDDITSVAASFRAMVERGYPELMRAIELQADGDSNLVEYIYTGYCPGLDVRMADTKK